MRFLLVVMLLMTMCRPVGAEEVLYMRVVARDDTAIAQREKYAVRNAALLLGPGGVELLEKWHPLCRVERKIWQPDEKTPPAETVYITIGPGEGRNWWGVIYPQASHWAMQPGEEAVAFPFLHWLKGLFIRR